MYQLFQKLNLTGQVKIAGSTSPFWLDCGQQDGGIKVFIREDIPVKFLSPEYKSIEGLYIELKFSRQKVVINAQKEYP